MYNKPMILTNSDLAEGVYAASGCFTVVWNTHQRPENGRGDYRIQVNAQHSASHTCSEQYLVITFNQPVVFKECGAAIIDSSASGTSLRLVRRNHCNGNDNIGFGDVVVESDPGLEVVSMVVTDNGTN